MNSHDIMNEQVMVIALLVFLNSVKTSPDINIKCPSEKHWFLRAQSFCLSVKQYTCLLDYVNNVYKENCNGPKTEPPGDKTVINSGNFDTESCFIERFQPFSFSTLHGNDCIYNKAICTEEGQLIYSNGTNLSNRKCRCDYTKNFSFVSTNRVDICSCDPFIEDCSCHIKLCSKGQSVSPDYQCVKIEDSYGKFVCKDIEMQSIDSQTEKHKETIRAQIRKKVVQYVKSHAEIWRVCLTGIVVVSGILCIILILQRYEKTEIINTDQNTKPEEDKSKYRIHKATVEFYKDRPYEFTVLKDLIEDKTIEIYECNENTTEPNTFRKEAPEADAQAMLSALLTRNVELTNSVSCLLKTSIAPRTRTQYECGYSAYATFLRMTGVIWLYSDMPPLTEESLIHFSTHCFKNLHLKCSTIKMYICGIRYKYLENGKTSIFSDSSNKLYRLDALYRGIKKNEKKSTKPRLPITFTILKDICQFLRKGYYTQYVDILLEAACVTAYFGFLRCGEFTVLHSFDSECNVSIEDIRFLKDKVTFHLKASKTDPFREGVDIHLFASGASVCPVLSLERYLDYRTRKFKDSKSQDAFFVMENRKALTRNYFISSLKNILAVLGYNSDLYNGHSFRIGASTTAGSKIEDHLIQTLGRWSSQCYTRCIRTYLSTIQQAQQALVE